jgi:hypothetical protein
VSPLELVDDRFAKVSEELRASRPVAPAVLRTRVADLTRAEPAPRRWELRLPTRRVVLGLAAAALVASFVAAGMTGLNRSGGHRAARPDQSREPVTVQKGVGVTSDSTRAAKAAPVVPLSKPFSVLAPTGQRLQRYDATLRLRVDDVDALSSASRRAMNLTRALGGYVASVNYATRGGKRGGATLVLRVPVTNVETALGELTSLGTILQQRTGILDITRRADREARQIAQLERELEAASPAEAAVIRHRLETLRAKHARLLRSARFARIALSLTTPEPEAATPPGRLHRTLDDAGSVLVRELEILLYALVVAGPLLLLGAAAVAAGRAQRRRSDRRLLERA